jgi:RNA polymerase sigma-70 factor (ECF subfamily)
MVASIAREGTLAAASLATKAEKPSSDETLIARIAQCDQLAMRMLVLRHQTALYRWLKRIVLDVALAEDLVSEVFLDVWRQAPSFGGRSSVSTWLFAVARYKALSARRRRRDAELDDDAALRIPDPADDPEASLLKKDRSARIGRLLTNLSRKHREVLDLVYYHGKSVREVAEITGTAEATVKTRMFHARRRLAALMAA